MLDNRRYVESSAFNVALLSFSQISIMHKQKQHRELTNYTRGQLLCNEGKATEPNYVCATAEEYSPTIVSVFSA